MSFPTQRPRRLRSTPAIRDLFSEVDLSPRDFIAPMFIREALSDRREISTLPGVFQHSIDSLKKEIEEHLQSDVRAVMLFGIPEIKDANGSAAWSEDGIAQLAIREVKAHSVRT